MRRRSYLVPTRQFREKVLRDVALIKECAHIVVRLDENEAVQVWENLNPTIGVIAIIGPGKTPRGYHFSEVILEEIGIGPSRPYHKGKIPAFLQEAGKPRAITYRYRGFALSEPQYRVAAPIVFGLIQQLADRRIAGWESGTSFCASGEKNYYSRTREKLYNFPGLHLVRRGARFSAARESFFAQDIFWAAQMLNISVLKLARLINMRLDHRLERWRGRVEFNGLKRSKEIEDFFEKSFFPRYLWIAAMFLLPGGEKNRFVPFLRQMMDFQEATTPEWDFAQESLLGQKSRLKDMQLRVTTGLNKTRDYIVFEVFPSRYWRDYIVRQPAVCLEYEKEFDPEFDPEKDIPF